MCFLKASALALLIALSVIAAMLFITAHLGILHLTNKRLKIVNQSTISAIADF